MNRRFALALGAFGLFTMVGMEVAEAGRRGVRFGGGGGGGVSFSGRVAGGVHWASPARSSWRGRSWSMGGHVRVGGPRFRPYRPYFYPTFVPSFYGATVYSAPYYGDSYYPVAPAAGPSVVAVVAAEPLLPTLGIGLFAGGVSVEDVSESSDVGVLGRFRLGQGGLLIEGELGKQSYADNLRIDRRLGASLIWEIGARNRFAPYLLAGLGVQQADVAGTYTTNQNFAEIGVGARYAITPRFHLTADIRAGSRDTMSSDDPPMISGTAARMVAPPSSDSGENENYTRARLSAILYF